MAVQKIFEAIIRSLQAQGGMSRDQADTIAPPDKLERIIPVLIEENVDAIALATAVHSVLKYPCYNPDEMENEARWGSNYVLHEKIAYLVNPLGQEQKALLSRRKAEGLEIEGIGILPYNLISSHSGNEDDTQLTVAAEALFDSIIEEAIQAKASDIHIKPQHPEAQVLFRVDGRLTKSNHRIPLGREYESLADKILMLCDSPGGVYQSPVSGRVPYTRNNKRFPIRVEMNPTQVSEHAYPRFVMRIPDQASSSIMQLPKLGLSKQHTAVLDRLARSPDGLILVTGPTGSGKTTTLYAMLAHISDKMPYKSISTLEDPVEVEIPRFNQIQVNDDQKIGFGAGIRSLLRSDPDVILVGEIRDQETGVQALRAAITGHLILSTLHTKDAVKSIGRLLDLGLSTQILADALLAVTAQRMVRKLCPHCAVETPFNQITPYYNRYNWHPDAPRPEDRILTHNAQGCRQCRHTGYSGRISINEIMEVDETIAAMIAKGEPTQAIRNQLDANGFKDLWSDGFRLIKEKKTCFTEVESVLGIKTPTIKQTKEGNYRETHEAH